MTKANVKKTEAAKAEAPVMKEEVVKAEAVTAAEPEKKEEVKKPRGRKATAAKEEAPAAEKKTAAGRTSKKAAAKTEAPAEEKKAPAEEKKVPVAEKKAPARKAAKKEAEVKATVSVQFAGKDYTVEKLVEIAKDVWQYDLGHKPEDFKTVELYVKTEEGAVYYVINGETTGNFAI